MVIVILDINVVRAEEIEMRCAARLNVGFFFCCIGGIVAGEADRFGDEHESIELLTGGIEIKGNAVHVEFAAGEDNAPGQVERFGRSDVVHTIQRPSGKFVHS